MTNLSRLFAAVAVAAACAWSPGTHAAADTATCTGYINALPASITTPGTWCLRKDLATPIASGAAIQIDGPDITLDCHGFRIAGSAGPAGTANGIEAYMVENPVVRGCHVSGFEEGVMMFASAGVVEDSRFENNGTGIHAGQDIGTDHMYLEGAATVRRNLVRDSHRAGISVWRNAVVHDNIVDGIVGAGDAGDHFGIVAEGFGSVVIAGNIVRGLRPADYAVRGIDVMGTATASIRRNIVIAGADVEGGYAIYCNDGAQSTVENRLSGWTYAHRECTSHADVVVP